ATYAAAVSPENATRARIFIPTRPSLMKPGESLRIFIVAPGHESGAKLNLLTRRQGIEPWQSFPAVHAGRSVYTAQLGPFAASDGAIEYCVRAANEHERSSASEQSSSHVCTLNLLA
ncbi:MAG: hypothetical protein ACRD28_14010, partial [Acidobacteriaceae bacterium]